MGPAQPSAPQPLLPGAAHGEGTWSPRVRPQWTCCSVLYRTVCCWARWDQGAGRRTLTLDRAVLHQLLHDLRLLQGGRRRGECPLRARPWPSCSLPLPLTQVQTYTGAEAVGRRDLVDVIGMDVVIGAAGSGLALAPTRGPGVHHAAGRGACLRLLPARERVAVVRHNPGGAAGRSRGGVSWSPPRPLPPALSPAHMPRCSPSPSQEPPGAIQMPTAAALLVVLVTGQQVLGRQDGCHVPQRMD